MAWARRQLYADKADSRANSIGAERITKTPSLEKYRRQPSLTDKPPPGQAAEESSSSTVDEYGSSTEDEGIYLLHAARTPSDATSRDSTSTHGSPEQQSKRQKNSKTPVELLGAFDQYLFASNKRINETVRFEVVQLASALASCDVGALERAVLDTPAGVIETASYAPSLNLALCSFSAKIFSGKVIRAELIFMPNGYHSANVANGFDSMSICLYGCVQNKSIEASHCEGGDKITSCVFGGEEHPLPNANLPIFSKFTMRNGRASFTFYDSIYAWRSFASDSIILRIESVHVVQPEQYYWGPETFITDVKKARVTDPQTLSRISQLFSTLILAKPIPLSIASQYWDAFTFRLRKMDSTVRERETGKLFADDCESVEAVGISLSLMVAEGLQLDRTYKMEKVVQSDSTFNLVLYRLNIFSGEGLNVRLHFFPDASETYIHNHKSHFISYCLGGQYEHSLYRVDKNKNGFHFEAKRFEDGQLGPMVLLPGKVVTTNVYTHKTNLAYFLHDASLHSVSVQKRADQTKPTPTLTLIAKDKSAESSQSSVVWPAVFDRESNSYRPGFGGPEVEPARMLEVIGEEKEFMLGEIEKILKACARDIEQWRGKRE